MVHHTKKHRKRNTHKRLTRKRLTRKRFNTRKRKVTRKRNIKYRAGACCASKPRSVSTKKSKTRSSDPKPKRLTSKEIIRIEYKNATDDEIKDRIFGLQETGLRVGLKSRSKASLPQYYSSQIKILEDILKEREGTMSM
jgi:hypothetical protein